MKIPANGSIYEINARVWLRALRSRVGRSLTLATVPDSLWAHVRSRGFDAVWLMGLWAPSRNSCRIATQHPGLREEYDKALPDWTPEDVIGSPFAIANYTLNPELGNEEDLVLLRNRLHSQGLALIVDFVPNHTATDHPWIVQHPEYYLQGDSPLAQQFPEDYFEVKTPEGSKFIAHGRDPFFPPWTDTAQLDLFSPAVREELSRILLQLTDVADGVRCDMAMLCLDEIFTQTWNHLPSRPYSRPLENEFWSAVIAPTKKKRPEFLFIAECYWGKENALRTLGFDAAYDKGLYDAFRSGSPIRVLQHVDAMAHGINMVRFVENHDEPRAISAFGPDRHAAAALATYTLPGLKLFHDGQLEGRHVRLPVQLARSMLEMPCVAATTTYEKILAVLNLPTVRTGRFTTLQWREAWPYNNSYTNFLAWSWSSQHSHVVVVINYSPNTSQTRLSIPCPMQNLTLTLNDVWGGCAYRRNCRELWEQGLFVELPGYGAHVFTYEFP